MTEQTNNQIELKISKHAYDRMKERNGWNRKTADRMLRKIYENGSRPTETKGREGTALRKKLQKQKKQDNEGKEYLVYGEQIYVFCNHVMLTVLPPLKMDTTRKRPKREQKK